MKKSIIILSLFICGFAFSQIDSLNYKEPPRFVKDKYYKEDLSFLTKYNYFNNYFHYYNGLNNRINLNIDLSEFNEPLEIRFKLKIDVNGKLHYIGYKLINGNEHYVKNTLSGLQKFIKKINKKTLKDKGIKPAIDKDGVPKEYYYEFYNILSNQRKMTIIIK